MPPLVPPKGLLNHATVAAFNEFWFRKAPKRRIGQIVSIPRFFHPLDAVGHWNRLYGRRGFVQYQFVVPFGRGGRAAARRRAAGRVGHGQLPRRAQALRRGERGAAQLSRSRDGRWPSTCPGAASGLVELLAGLDEVVLDAGGRHYFAKDAATTPDAIRRGYPRLAEWQAVRDRVDPHRRWASDQSRRLRLTDHTRRPSWR